MSDATQLLHGLRDYSSTLDKHLSLLREGHKRLEAAWIPARDVYQGHGAEVFAAAFERASAMVQAYIATAEAVLPVLKDRIEYLSRFDSPTDPSL
jgi:phytoene/squalene synthetase